MKHLACLSSLPSDLTLRRRCKSDGDMVYFSYQPTPLLTLTPTSLQPSRPKDIDKATSVEETSSRPSTMDPTSMKAPSGSRLSQAWTGARLSPVEATDSGEDQSEEHV